VLTLCPILFLLEHYGIKDSRGSDGHKVDKWGGWLEMLLGGYNDIPCSKLLVILRLPHGRVIVVNV
jgi:hypothetical protein